MARASHYDEDKAKVLDLVHSAAVAHGRPPSVRDLAEQLGVGVATMHSYLRKLSDEGLVEWAPGRHRSLRVTSSGVHAISA